MEAANKEASWPWPDSLDGVIAAPQSHRVLFENDQVRVLEVVIEPSLKEPPHTHRAPSVFVVTETCRVRYFEADGHLANEFVPPTGPRWFDPQGLHAVENVDSARFHAIRVELKR